MKLKLLIAALAISLSACASMVSGGFSDLKAGVSTAAEVEGRVGKPNFVWKNADGSQQWEYSNQPFRQSTYMVMITPDNKVLAADQVLTRPQFFRVESGMTEDQVRRLMGAPGTVTTNLKNETVWDWNVEDFMPDMRQHFLAYFRNGKVTRIDILTYQEN